MVEYNYLIIYDISDEKRLRRIAKLMESYGVRVQKSVFETKLNLVRLSELKKKATELIDEKEDGMKFFKFCPKCWQKKDCIGEQFDTNLFQPLLIV